MGRAGRAADTGEDDGSEDTIQDGDGQQADTEALHHYEKGLTCLGPLIMWILLFTATVVH